MVPDGVAMIALDLDVGRARFAARTTGALELAREILEKARVPGQALDDCYRLAPAPCLLDPEPSDDPVRHSLDRPRRAATVLLRPTAYRTHAALVG